MHVQLGGPQAVAGPLLPLPTQVLRQPRALEDGFEPVCRMHSGVPARGASNKGAKERKGRNDKKPGLQTVLRSASKIPVFLQYSFFLRPSFLYGLSRTLSREPRRRSAKPSARWSFLGRQSEARAISERDPHLLPPSNHPSASNSGRSSTSCRVPSVPDTQHCTGRPAFSSLSCSPRTKQPLHGFKRELELAGLSPQHLQRRVHKNLPKLTTHPTHVMGAESLYGR